MYFTEPLAVPTVIGSWDDLHFLPEKQKTRPSFYSSAGTGTLFFPAVPPGLISLYFRSARSSHAYRHMLDFVDGDPCPGADTCSFGAFPLPSEVHSSLPLPAALSPPATLWMGRNQSLLTLPLRFFCIIPLEVYESQEFYGQQVS